VGLLKRCPALASITAGVPPSRRTHRRWRRVLAPRAASARVAAGLGRRAAAGHQAPDLIHRSAGGCRAGRRGSAPPPNCFAAPSAPPPALGGAPAPRPPRTIATTGMGRPPIRKEGATPRRAPGCPPRPRHGLGEGHLLLAAEERPAQPDPQLRGVLGRSRGCAGARGRLIRPQASGRQGSRLWLAALQRRPMRRSAPPPPQQAQGPVQERLVQRPLCAPASRSGLRRAGRTGHPLGGCPCPSVAPPGLPGWTGSDVSVSCPCPSAGWRAIQTRSSRAATTLSLCEAGIRGRRPGSLHARPTLMASKSAVRSARSASSVGPLMLTVPALPRWRLWDCAARS
jgi:hypothetical protein